MAMINANEIEKKMFILIDGQPYAVLDTTIISPSARGASSLVKARVRHLLNGLVQDKTFKTGEKFEIADVEESSASFLYSDDQGFHFMDETSYEQFTLNREKISDLAGFLKENMKVLATRFNDRYVAIQLPVYVELKVTYAEPAVRGDSSGSVNKKAKLETGIEVNVPMYVKEGDVVQVNTQTGEVKGRA